MRYDKCSHFDSKITTITKITIIHNKQWICVMSTLLLFEEQWKIKSNCHHKTIHVYYNKCVILWIWVCSIPLHGAIQNTRAYVITQKLMHITNSYNRNKFNKQINCVDPQFHSTSWCCQKNYSIHAHMKLLCIINFNNPFTFSARYSNYVIEKFKIHIYTRMIVTNKTHFYYSTVYTINHVIFCWVWCLVFELKLLLPPAAIQNSKKRGVHDQELQWILNFSVKFDI